MTSPITRSTISEHKSERYTSPPGHFFPHKLVWIALNKFDYKILDRRCKQAHTLDLVDARRNTPLHIVAQRGDLQATLILLKYPEKINIDQENREGITAPKLAIDQGRLMIYLHMKAAFPNAACFEEPRRCVGQVESLLAQDPINIEELDRLLLLLLYYFEVEAIFKICSLNLPLNINIAHLHSGDTLVHLACQTRSLDLLKSLLNYPDIRLDRVNKFGESPLSSALLFGTKDIIKLLLDDNRVDKNSRHAQTGDSMLHIASSRGDPSIVQLLLSYPDLNRNLINNAGETPLCEACRYRNKEIIQLLLSDNKVMINDYINPRTGGGILHIACSIGDPSIVQLLLSCPGLNRNLINKAGETPLYEACRFQNIEIIQLLLSDDKVMIRDYINPKTGQTVFDFAVDTCSEEIQDMLYPYFEDQFPSSDEEIFDDIRIW